MTWLTALVLFIVGGWFALFGQRNFNFVLALIGLLLGLLGGHLLTLSYEEGSLVRVAGLLAGGVAGIFLNLFLFYVNLALMGVKVGMAATLLIILFLYPEMLADQKIHLSDLLFLLFGGLAGGVFALIYRKLLIVILTAMYGTACWIVGFAALFRPEGVEQFISRSPLQSMTETSGFVYLLWVVLTVGACLVQYRYTGTFDNYGRSNRTVTTYPKRE